MGAEIGTRGPAAEGRITVRGALGGAVQPAAAQHVYDGDRPSPYQTAWQEAMAEVEAALVQARTDRDTARQLLGTAQPSAAAPSPASSRTAPSFSAPAFPPSSCRARSR